MILAYATEDVKGRADLDWQKQKKTATYVTVSYLAQDFV